jgi:hypothetical protein
MQDHPPTGHKDNELGLRCRELRAACAMPVAALLLHHPDGWVESGLSVDPDLSLWICDALRVGRVAFHEQPSVRAMFELDNPENRICQHLAETLNVRGAALVLMCFVDGEVTLRVGICGDGGLVAEMPRMMAFFEERWGRVCGN